MTKAEIREIIQDSIIQFENNHHHGINLSKVVSKARFELSDLFPEGTYAYVWTWIDSDIEAVNALVSVENLDEWEEDEAPTEWVTDVKYRGGLWVSQSGTPLIEVYRNHAAFYTVDEFVEMFGE